MYGVSVRYHYEYEAYGKTNTMNLSEFFVVSAKNQYESIEKTKNFLLERVPNAELTDIKAELLETGRHGYMTTGIIN